jgi:hypothetical protein
MKEYITATKYGTFIINMSNELVVNDELEWNLSFIAGENIEKGASIKIAVPAYQHQRSEEYLQTYDYWKPNYIYAFGEEDDIKVNVKIEKVPTAFSHINRWVDSSRIAVVTLENGLKEGNKISVKFGGIDRPWLEGECVPSRVSQFSFRTEGTYLKYEVSIDIQGEGTYEEVEVFPPIKIVPDIAKKIIITAPTVIKTKDQFNIKFNVVDRFNNPIFDYNSDAIKFSVYNLETKEKTVVEKENNEFKTSILKEGFYEISVDNLDLDVEKAILMCDDSLESIYWGDTHIHSNLTANIRDNDCGASPRQGYLYAKNVSFLDYICMSEQTFVFNEDRSVNIDENTWNKIGEEADKHYEIGELVTFPGVELHSKRGDTIVLFKDSLTKYSYPSEDVVEVNDLWNLYKDKELITIPHFHRYCEGRPRKDQQEKKYSGFDLKNWEASSDKEVLCEIFSSQWGRFENQNHPMILKARDNVPGNTVAEFLNRGKKWGITANSDGHDGKPGYGGVTGVFASDKTREVIFEGLQNRKTIASTHPRLFINININGHNIGDIINENDEIKTINVTAIAPNDIKVLEIIKNGETIFREPCTKQYIYKSFTYSNTTDEDEYYYVRVILKNGHIGWTSPIWFNKK